METKKIIRDERKKRKLTQSELAKKLGVSQATITMIEAGRRGASDELKVKIANYFNLSIEYIFFNDINHKW